MDWGEFRWRKIRSRLGRWRKAISWPHVFGFVGATTVFAVIAVHGWRDVKASERQYAEDYEKSAAYEAGKMRGEVQVECARITLGEPLDCTIDVPEPSQPDYTAQKDLQAQQDMAVWTRSLGWLGILGLLASVVGIGFVYANLAALRKQTDVTREIGQAQVRAYPSVSRIAIRLPRRGPAQFAFQGAIRNSGQTVARRVVIRVRTRWHDKAVIETLPIEYVVSPLAAGEEKSFDFEIYPQALDGTEIHNLHQIGRLEVLTDVTAKDVFRKTIVSHEKFECDWSQSEDRSLFTDLEPERPVQLLRVGDGREHREEEKRREKERRKAMRPKTARIALSRFAHWVGDKLHKPPKPKQTRTK